MSLSEEEIQGCHRAFQEFDEDNSGSIDQFELKKVLHSMGQDPTDEEILALMAEVDEDNSGAISFSEFLDMVALQKGFAEEKDDETDMIDAFVALGGGADKSGHILRSLLVQVIKEDFGLPIDIEGMIDELDEDGSGEIEWVEFETMFKQRPQQMKIEPVRR